MTAAPEPPEAVLWGERTEGKDYQSFTRYNQTFSVGDCVEVLGENMEVWRAVISRLVRTGPLGTVWLQWFFSVDELQKEVTNKKILQKLKRTDKRKLFPSTELSESPIDSIIGRFTLEHEENRQKPSSVLFFFNEWYSNGKLFHS